MWYPIFPANIVHTFNQDKDMQTFYQSNLIKREIPNEMPLFYLCFLSTFFLCFDLFMLNDTETYDFE